MRTTMPWSDTNYPAIRRVMGPERDRLDDGALEDLLADLFPEAAPGDVEDFMRTVQNFGKQVAPLAQRALPGIVQGAKTGMSVAGPWGAIAGAIGGGAASLLGGGARRGRPPAQPAPPVQPASPPAVSPPVQEPGAAAPMQPPGPAPTGAMSVAGAAAPAQLMALLSRPETMQALLSMMMAGAGKGTIAVGSQAVPAPAFANAISELAEEVAEYAAAPAGGRGAGYFLDPAGNPRGDIANPAERASILLADIAEVAGREADEAREAADQRDDVEWSTAIEAIEDSNALDGYEAALEGRHPYDG